MLDGLCGEGTVRQCTAISGRHSHLLSSRGKGISLAMHKVSILIKGSLRCLSLGCFCSRLDLGIFAWGHLDQIAWRRMEKVSSAFQALFLRSLVQVDQRRLASLFKVRSVRTVNYRNQATVTPCGTHRGSKRASQNSK